MRITTLKSAKALKWIRIKAAFYSKGLFFPIVKLLTSKSALQDSIYGPTVNIMKYVICCLKKTQNMAFLSQKRAPGVNFVEVLNAPKKAFTKPPLFYETFS